MRAVPTAIKRFNRIARRITLNRLRFNVCAGPTRIPAGAGRSVRRQTARTPTSVSSNVRRAGMGPAPPKTGQTRYPCVPFMAKGGA